MFRDFQLAPYFVRRTARWREYAIEQAAEFSLESAMEMPCMTCGGPREGVACYEWSATLFAGWDFSPIDMILFLTFGQIMLRLRYAWPRFTTHHATCHACWERTQNKLALSDVLNTIALVGLLLGAIGLLGLPILGMTIRRNEMYWFVPACTIAVISIIGGVIAFRLVKNLRASGDHSQFANTPYYLKRYKLIELA